MTEVHRGGPVTANLHYGGAYQQHLADAARTGACPFCEELKDGRAVVWRDRGWFAKEVPDKWRATSYWPKADPIEIPAALVVLLIPERHVTEISEFTAEDWAGLGIAFAQVRARYDIAGGGLGLRFDDPKLCGRTVMHLHAHVIVPPENPNEAGAILPVPFWIG